MGWNSASFFFTDARASWQWYSFNNCRTQVYYNFSRAFRVLEIRSISSWTFSFLSFAYLHLAKLNLSVSSILSAVKFGDWWYRWNLLLLPVNGCRHDSVFWVDISSLHKWILEGYASRSREGTFNFFRIQEVQQWHHDPLIQNYASTCSRRPIYYPYKFAIRYSGREFGLCYPEFSFVSDQVLLITALCRSFPSSSGHCTSGDWCFRAFNVAKWLIPMRTLRFWSMKFDFRNLRTLPINICHRMSLLVICYDIYHIWADRYEKAAALTRTYYWN